MQIKIRLRSSALTAHPQHPAQHNLFVRLHPNRVRTLHAETIRLLIEEREERDENGGDADNGDLWHVTKHMEGVVIDFLPLQIAFHKIDADDDGVSRKFTCYASYNGGSCENGTFCHVLFHAIFW